MLLRDRGRKENVPCIPGEWLTLHREWTNGEIHTSFPFRLGFETVDAFNQDIVALSYGLRVLCTDTITVLRGYVTCPENWIHRKEGYNFETDHRNHHSYFFIEEIDNVNY